MSFKDYDSWKLRSDFDDKWPPEEEWPEDHTEDPPEEEEEKIDCKGVTPDRNVRDD
jgi:hypothetical protein